MKSKKLKEKQSEGETKTKKQSPTQTLAPEETTARKKLSKSMPDIEISS